MKRIENCFQVDEENGCQELKVTIVGSGIVGYATGIGFRNKGHRVTFCDVDKTLLQKLRGQGLTAVGSVEAALQNSEVAMLCLPTPFVNDTLDLSCLEEAAEEVGRYLDSETVVVRSTVIPGTTKRLSSLIPPESLVYNPEFLREAYAVEDFMNPHRIVIGATSRKAATTLRELYHGFDAPIIETDWETAEMAKLVSNAFLATKISFFNEIWLICQRLSLEMEEVIRIVALDKRIGPYGTQGGKPFGGKCLPKDVEALINFAKRGGEDPKLLEATLNINGRFPQDAS